MGRWDKEFSNKNQKATPGYPKRKGRLRFKLFMMVPVLIMIALVSILFSIAFNWDITPALFASTPIVLIPFAWLYTKYLDNKL